MTTTKLDAARLTKLAQRTVENGHTTREQAVARRLGAALIARHFNVQVGTIEDSPTFNTGWKQDCDNALMFFKVLFMGGN